ncbi:MAG: hypothetical protein JW895_10280 [Thermoleophilaceae bacterium]|nr:hypothetical protein [Thermoleophilaceae bacterium]
MTDLPTITETEAKPLRLTLPPRTKENARALRRLRGHSTAPNWIPAGLSGELDALRGEHLRLLGQVAAELAALDATSARFRREDQDHARALREAQRDGVPDSVEDTRTSTADRRSVLVAITERYWAAVAVLADLVDAVVSLYRQREDEWLADLRAQLGPIEEERREAQRVLDEARAKEWLIHRLGQHVQITSEAGPHGFQPAPAPEPPPPQFSAEVFESMLRRPWHRGKAWSDGEGEEEVRGWLETSQDQSGRPGDVDSLSAEDETGTVLPLDPSVSGVSS